MQMLMTRILTVYIFGAEFGSIALTPNRRKCITIKLTNLGFAKYSLMF